MQQFTIGDKVIYPVHGVGEIKGFESIKVGDETHDCIVMAYERGMTLRVPRAKAEQLGLRGVSSKDTVRKAFRVFRDQPRIQKGIWARRSREIEEKINSGDLIQISQVLRDLTPRNLSERGLSYSERQFYETALTRVSMEISAVMGKGIEETRTEILKALSEQPKPIYVD